MKKIFFLIATIVLFSVATFSQTTPASSPTPAPTPAPYDKLKVGDVAPDFTLPDLTGKPVKLSEFRGKNNVVLAFYVFAFTGGWTKELQNYQAGISKFEAANTKVFGISMDSRFANAAFAEKAGVTSFQLLSDWTRVVTKDYGLYNEVRQFGRRATFVVDKEGKIQQVVIDSLAIDPTSTLEACSLMEKKLVVAPPKP